ncbi:PTS sugar transporter subunit IIB [Anaerofustis butyriciformans]|uniref:PTS sugar transporter subunit IIB n=1 Tax=Anaerofustis TaxID=264995 RepID=UPI002E35A0C4|nr:PTS galactitol transporter subunit IIB [Anaerofustis sp. HA2171]
MKTILVACGTGIATSTVAAKKCEGICKEAGIQVKTVQCKAAEAASKVKVIKPDVIVGTTDIPGDIGDTVLLNGRCLLTGVGLNQFKEDLINAVK